MAKLGVVIFNDDYSGEGLAALRWASDFSLSTESLRILFVKDVHEPNKPTIIGEETKGKEKLCALVAEKMNSTITLFDEYMKEFTTQAVSGRPYEGSNIQKILEGAIKEFQLDTLVLGMAALGSTRGHINLQLNSECSVVLAKKDPNPLETTFEISAPPMNAAGRSRKK